ncbi:uncharacterized protein LOC132043231 [Lycium ferocissimum]|uniref:uncharacterized protein LOC132043231 n=1 Tax=Lycium ferocissimum TaxID=112874 RepID=UPI0028164182|nr:uncharacterized protein LOC132043231 [Lycium ferocissimum]
MVDGTKSNMVTRGIPSTLQNFGYPSFDLGISQQQHDVVAGSAERIIAERRTKNNHDPSHMQRLKKPVVTKSTKKIVTGKEMKRKKVVQHEAGEQEEFDPAMKQDDKFFVQYPPSHAIRYASYMNPKVKKELKDKLIDRQFELFSKTIFGKYLDMQHREVQPQMFRCFIVRELKKCTPTSFVIDVNGFELTFKLFDFALMTGLKCFGEEIVVNSKKNRLLDTYFGGSNKSVKKGECFEDQNWGVDDDADGDAVKIALLYFIHTYILSGEKNNVVIPRLHFDLVESGRYVDYTWGKEAFDDLVRSLHHKMDKTKQYYCLCGFPFAMQAWLYECCSNVYPNLAVKNGDRIPRMFNWKTIDGTPHFKDLMTGMFNDDESEDRPTYRNIVPTISEIEELGLRPYLSGKSASTIQQQVADDYDDFSSTPPHVSAAKQPQNKGVSQSPPHKKPRQMPMVPSPSKKTTSPITRFGSHSSGGRLTKRHELASTGHASAMEKESAPIPNPPSVVPIDVPSTSKSKDISILREELNEYKNKDLHKAINENFAKVFEYIKVNQTK